MDDKTLLTGWKLIAYSAGAILVMMLFLFRLDELIFRRKKRSRRLKKPMGTDASGRTMYSDPDGRPWKRSARK